MEGLVYGKEIMDSSRWADISINVENRALNGLLEDQRLMPWIRCWMINVLLHLFRAINTFKWSSSFFSLIMIKNNYTKYPCNMSKDSFDRPHVGSNKYSTASYQAFKARLRIMVQTEFWIHPLYVKIKHLYPWSKLGIYQTL